MDRPELDDELWSGIVAGDRRALARAISLCESARADHRLRAEALVARASAEPRLATTARIGLTGPAGVGKSTLIDTLGQHLLQAGHRPAVLAVDPSSRRTGGSLLGDQTRMPRLARGDAFVRPSPTRGHLGGAGAYTLEAAILCAAAGFEPVLIETVGVGQNETEIDDLVDLVVLLLQPGAGDEVQGMKRGLLEHVDVLVVAKADGPLLGVAEETRARFAGALRLLRGPTAPSVALVSAQEGTGIAELWQVIEAQLDERRQSGAFAERRARQRRAWFRNGLVAALTRAVDAPGGLRERWAHLEEAAAHGELSVPEAVRAVLEGLSWSPHV